ncbi:hypothetical protein SB766_06750 [Pseudomonas sp. SIMBA_077]
MTNVTDKEDDQLLQECADFTFTCAGCAAEQKINYQGVHDLTQGLSIQCTACDVQLKASTDDQACMSQLSAEQVNFGKGVLVFCVLWFSTSILVFIIYGPLAAGLMGFAGFFISAALKFSSDEGLQVFNLELANEE